MAPSTRRQYVVRRRTERIDVDGRLDEADWQAAEPLTIDQYMETVPPGRRNVQTICRLLWDDWTLYLGYHSLDEHIESRHTVHNALVWTDTCVEFFVSPEAGNPADYYTWEINCCGVTLNKCCCGYWDRDPADWRPADAIATSVPGPVKQAHVQDKEWVCEAAIPFSNFLLAPVPVPPRTGDVWRANFQQCAGPKSHLATWSPLPPGAQTFHTPAAFGELIFSQEPVR